MRRVTITVLCVALFGASAALALGLTGCTTSQEAQPSLEKAQRIKLSGSGTCMPLMELLGAAYEKSHPGSDIVFLPGAHSSAGVQGAINGTLDIGLVSRDLKPEEKALGLEHKNVSNDGLAVFTNSDVNISNLSAEQVKAIYAGTITNWKEVGGPDAKIVVLDRAEDESAKIILRKYVVGDVKVVEGATVLYFESDMVDALKTTPYAIGYFSLGYATSEKLHVNMVSLNGIKPSVANIHNGSYKVVRPLAVVYKTNPKGLAKAFIDYCLGPEGKKVMEKNGYASAR